MASNVSTMNAQSNNKVVQSKTSKSGLVGILKRTKESPSAPSPVQSDVDSVHSDVLSITSADRTLVNACSHKQTGGQQSVDTCPHHPQLGGRCDCPWTQQKITGQVSTNNDTVNTNSPIVPRTVTLERDPEMGFGFVAGSVKPVVIRFVKEGGPSEGKLQSEDQILAINGEDVSKADRERVIELVKSCNHSVTMTVCQPDHNSGIAKKSAILSAAKKARLKGVNPHCKPRVRFAEGVTVNVTSVVPSSGSSSDHSKAPFMFNVLKVFRKNGKTKTLKYKTSTTTQPINGQQRSSIGKVVTIVPNNSNVSNMIHPAMYHHHHHPEVISDGRRMNQTVMDNDDTCSESSQIENNEHNFGSLKPMDSLLCFHPHHRMIVNGDTASIENTGATQCENGKSGCHVQASTFVQSPSSDQMSSGQQHPHQMGFGNVKLVDTISRKKKGFDPSSSDSSSHHQILLANYIREAGLRLEKDGGDEDNNSTEAEEIEEEEESSLFETENELIECLKRLQMEESGIMTIGLQSGSSSILPSGQVWTSDMFRMSDQREQQNSGENNFKNEKSKSLENFDPEIVGFEFQSDGENSSSTISTVPSGEAMMLEIIDLTLIPPPGTPEPPPSEHSSSENYDTNCHPVDSYGTSNGYREEDLEITLSDQVDNLCSSFEQIINSQTFHPHQYPHLLKSHSDEISGNFQNSYSQSNSEYSQLMDAEKRMNPHISFLPHSSETSNLHPLFQQTPNTTHSMNSFTPSSSSSVIQFHPSSSDDAERKSRVDETDEDRRAKERINNCRGSNVDEFIASVSIPCPPTSTGTPTGSSTPTTTTTSIALNGVRKKIPPEPPIRKTSTGSLLTTVPPSQATFQSNVSNHRQQEEEDEELLSSLIVPPPPNVTTSRDQDDVIARFWKVTDDVKKIYSPVTSSAVNPFPSHEAPTNTQVVIGQGLIPAISNCQQQPQLVPAGPVVGVGSTDISPKSSSLTRDVYSSSSGDSGYESIATLPPPPPSSSSSNQNRMLPKGIPSPSASSSSALSSTQSSSSSNPSLTAAAIQESAEAHEQIGTKSNAKSGGNFTNTKTGKKIESKIGNILISKSSQISREKVEFLKSVTQAAIDESSHENTCSTQIMLSSPLSPSSPYPEEKEGVREGKDEEKRQGCEKLTVKEEEEEKSSKVNGVEKQEERIQTQEEEKEKEMSHDTHTNELMMDEDRIRKQHLPHHHPSSSSSFSPDYCSTSELLPPTSLRSSSCQVLLLSQSVNGKNCSSLPVTNPNTSSTITNPNPTKKIPPPVAKKPPIPPTSPSIQERRRQLMEKKLASNSKVGMIPTLSENEEKEKQKEEEETISNNLLSRNSLINQSEEESKNCCQSETVFYTETNLLNHQSLLQSASSQPNYNQADQPNYGSSNQLFNPYGGTGFNPCISMENYVNYRISPIAMANQQPLDTSDQSNSYFVPNTNTFAMIRKPQVYQLFLESGKTLEHLVDQMTLIHEERLKMEEDCQKINLDERKDCLISETRAFVTSSKFFVKNATEASPSVIEHLITCITHLVKMFQISHVILLGTESQVQVTALVDRLKEVATTFDRTLDTIQKLIFVPTTPSSGTGIDVQLMGHLMSHATSLATALSALMRTLRSLSSY